jgi:hypothetical protein
VLQGWKVAKRATGEREKQGGQEKQSGQIAKSGFQGMSAPEAGLPGPAATTLTGTVKAYSTTKGDLPFFPTFFVSITRLSRLICKYVSGTNFLQK